MNTHTYTHTDRHKRLTYFLFLAFESILAHTDSNIRDEIKTPSSLQLRRKGQFKKKKKKIRVLISFYFITLHSSMFFRFSPRGLWCPMVKDHWHNTCVSWHNTSHLMASRVCSSVFSFIIYFLICLSVRQFVEINTRSLLEKEKNQSAVCFYEQKTDQIILLKTLQWLHIHISTIYWYNGQGGESTQVTTNK